MIKWRLKHGGKETVFEFEVFSFPNSNHFSVVRAPSFKRSMLTKAFGDKYSDNVVTCNGISFIPEDEILPDVISQEGDHFKYFLKHGETRIEEIQEQSSAQELVMQISERSKIYVFRDYVLTLFLEFEHEQVKSLNLELANFDPELREFDTIHIVVETLNNSGVKAGIFFDSKLRAWKSDLMIKFPGQKFKYIDFDVDAQIRKELDVDSLLGDDLSVHFTCSIDGEKVDIPVKTFMRFYAYAPPIVEPSSELSREAYNLPVLESSFRHDLTKIGKLALEQLEKDILDRYEPWIYSTTLLAPIVSLCQSSGSGKSKLSFELLKRHLGFYIVLRLIGQTGYPLKNFLSDQLMLLISHYEDDSIDLREFEYSTCTVGKILDFIARVVTRRIVDLVELASQKPLSDAKEELANAFAKNTELSDYCLMDETEMKKLYFEYLKISKSEEKIVKVRLISHYIKAILLNPKRCFIRDLSSEEEEICNYIAADLRKFPFTFVVDEAEILAKTETLAKKVNSDSKVSGFEAFRRALSYLTPRTRLIVLTLGTKSNVIDLNPVIADASNRLKNRRELPFPIILSSNLNILSKKYPPHCIKPTCDMLLNPFYFKYLCTLGHSIWSSLPFNSVINTGIDKIINGTSANQDYVLFLWMILTGMAANPLSHDAGTMVANHMGYLLNISNDLKRLLVMYPPEPILSIIAHTIIDRKIKGNELFSVLQKKFDATDTDRGKTAELFGGMIILRAIWKSQDICIKDKDVAYNEVQQQMEELCPDLKPIWERNKNILQDDIRPDNEEDENDKCIEDFIDYKVHEVKGFLKKLLNIESDQILNDNLPRTILEGLVNGTQIVSLDDFSENLKFGSEDFHPKRPKLADDRIADSSRYIITEAMLRLCITMQLIIKFPPGYYGLDFAIPVLLRDNSLTFIGVQIKRANANLSDDVYKMRAKFHYVKCPDSDCIGEGCQKCTEIETLKNIYKNQVSIILSLDEKETFPKFTPSTFNYATEGTYAMNLLKTGNRAGRKPSELNKNFFKPLATIRKPLKDDVLISKSVWCDELVGITNINISKNKTIPFVKDGFVHRQYCISIRGWNNFSSLFTSPDSCEKVAQKLMNPEGLIRHFPEHKDNADFIRKIVYDLSLTFPFYSEELRRAQGEISWFDKLTRSLPTNSESEVTEVVSNSEIEDHYYSETTSVDDGNNSNVGPESEVEAYSEKDNIEIEEETTSVPSKRPSGIFKNAAKKQSKK